MLERDKTDGLQPAAPNMRGARVLVIAACVLGLGALAAAAYFVRLRMEPVVLGTALPLAGLGLMGILAWLGGFIRFAAGNGEQAFFDGVADAFGDAAVVTDAKGRAVYANRAYIKLASKAQTSRLIGIDVLYAGYPDFAEPIYQLAQAAAEGTPLHRDIRVPERSSVPGASPDEAKWLRLSVAPVGVGGITGQTLWRLTDITGDRKHQESAFSRLQFIITYLDQAPAGFFSTLPDGKVDYVNATLAGWLGIQLVEAQRGSIPLATLIGEEGARVLTSMEPLASGSRTDRFSFPLRTRAGGMIPVEVVHRCDFDSQGQALPSRSMVLRRDEEEAQAPKSGDVAASLRAFSTSAPFGVAQIGEAGTIATANAAFLSLSPRLKLHGMLASAAVESDRAPIAAALKRAISGAEARVSCEVLFADDQPRAVQLTFSKLVGIAGQVTVFAIDRTENKALEVQLAQSQKMQAVGQLASGIAHDFNNVLTPIIGFADLLLAKMRPTDAAFHDIMNIKQNANRAANLVRQLLAFSRKQTMQPRVHALTEAMSDLGNLLGRVLGEKIELEISHARDLGLVMVDIHQFEQVIINLAVNARDAMPNGGKLAVKTFNLAREQSRETGRDLPEGDYVVCEVADTGSGIAQDILDKIWEPFFSTKDVGKGTGLGLSMVYGIIKQTGGYVFCDSTPGKGTKFTIYLPRHVPEKDAVAPPLPEKPEIKREDFTGRGRILVVEDEDSVRAFAIRALSSRGYTVVEADSGESALSVIENDEAGFELILSDVVMPEMDGPSLLAEIRKRGIATKVIFMSGYPEDAFERNLKNPDDFAFLQKPFSLKELLEKVKVVMG